MSLAQGSYHSRTWAAEDLESTPDLLTITPLPILFSETLRLKDHSRLVIRREFILLLLSQLSYILLYRTLVSFFFLTLLAFTLLYRIDLLLRSSTLTPYRTFTLPCSLSSSRCDFFTNAHTSSSSRSSRRIKTDYSFDAATTS